MGIIWYPNMGEFISILTKQLFGIDLKPDRSGQKLLNIEIYNSNKDWDYFWRNNKDSANSPTQKLSILWHPNTPKGMRGHRSIVQYVTTPIFGIDLKTETPWPNLINIAMYWSKKLKIIFEDITKAQKLVPYNNW